MTCSLIRTVREREYPGPRGGIFLNTAAYGLIPRSAAAASADLNTRRNGPGSFSDRELGPILRRARVAAAALLAVDAEEIALCPNTSYGVNLATAYVAQGPPGRIVLSQGEFPANVFPWLALRDRGFEVEVVRSDEMGRPVEERLLEAVAVPGTRALALSAVQFASGYMADLRSLGGACRSRGVVFAVDAIQALGVVPLHPRDYGIDVLTSGAQKWLCSPWASGFTYVARDLIERFESPVVNWLAMQGANDFEHMLDYDLTYLPDARRFELASLGFQDHLAMTHSVEMFLEMGVPAVRDHVHALHDPVLRWIEGRDDAVAITPRAPERRGGILSFTMPWVDRAAQALREAGVVCSLREGGIRLAPHFYNTADEMARVVEVLESVGARA